eukprot:CAMPEP_0196598818 /NCGR_PEP_ID=MMETSP1081-20130531/94525_1 /TAXON_ID=36882 /ORGANISM="Pyramimonas amylifera, Strain CCMP720" /LENGTH=254 /DNA_ID=CAMNT_0041924543 /DNA_START=854 /DNA_END=1615 /DNA_ORIENTATION=-
MAAVAATFLQKRSFYEIADLLSSVFPAVNWQPIHDKIDNDNSDDNIINPLPSERSITPVITLSHVDDAAFRYIILDTLVPDEYKLHQYTNRSGTHWIIDAGGNMGETAINYLIHFPNSKVIVIEAHPVMYVMSRWNFILNNFENGEPSRLIALNAAFGAPGGADMQMDDKNSFGMTGGSKAWKHNENADREKNNHFVIPAVSAQELYKKFDMKTIYILKMDCEGCEHSAVPSWNLDFMMKIESLVGEYHNLPNW